MFQVQTKELKILADGIEAETEEIRKNWDSFAQRVNNTRYYWRGGGAEEFYSMYEDMQNNMNDITGHLEMAHRELAEITDAYEKREQEAVILGKAL